MNIFAVDKDPRVAARMLCDKHVVKMILESAQMLKLAHLSIGPWYNHPCSKWVREGKANYEWLAQHALELCKEYTHRYKKVHSYEKTIIKLIENVPSMRKFKNNWYSTKFAQAMPDKYKDSSSVLAYRKYYLGEKFSFCRWTNREPPKWFLS